MKTYQHMVLTALGVVLLAVMCVQLNFFSNSAHADSNDMRIEGLYQSSCATCHANGVLGAAKKGDKAAWSAINKKPSTQLVDHVKSGYKNMPARGLCDRCSDADYTLLIKFMSQ